MDLLASLSAHTAELAVVGALWMTISTALGYT
jgi:hypothetical protein